MTPLQEAICRLVERQTGEPAQLVRERPASGGCIHEARFFELADGRRFFVKSSHHSSPDTFESEAEGLAALSAAKVPELVVPEVLATGAVRTAQGDAGTVFLVMEAIERGEPTAGFFRAFGRSFAELHRTARAERFGFAHDGYLGATPQPNPRSDDWVDFWRRHRLGHQLELARRCGIDSHQLLRLGDRVLDRLDGLLGDLDEPPSLLHGDLWSGNYLCDAAGRPVLIDPAAYYGHREADLAMARLFGGFPPAFYRAYEESWPLAPGHQRRGLLYELYHLLNHLNLFGSGYLGSCLGHLRQLAG